MWLRAEIWIWSVQHQHPPADWCLQDLCYTAQIPLAPGPSAAQRGGAVDPGDPLDPTGIRSRQQTKSRCVVVVEVGDGAQPLSKSGGRIDAQTENRPGHVESVARQPASGAVDQRIGDRKLELETKIGSRADCQNRPSCIEE